MRQEGPLGIGGGGTVRGEMRSCVWNVSAYFCVSMFSVFYCRWAMCESVNQKKVLDLCLRVCVKVQNVVKFLLSLNHTSHC